MKAINYPKEAFSLDALRGIAALSIIFWHWQHFFYRVDKPYNFNASEQPLFNFFNLFYTQGVNAVELFFCLSGFIFSWLYALKISEGKIKTLEFTIKRLSRLYPLYFVTFIATLVLQRLYFSYNQNYFIYQHNDIYHAVLNIFMISAWGLEEGWSFNAPAWSISIEVMLYGIFYLVCKSRANNIISFLTLVIAGTFVFDYNYKIGVGLVAFFSGCLSFILLNILMQKIGEKKTLSLLSILLVGVWCGIFYSKTDNVLIISSLGFNSLILFIFSVNIINHSLARHFKWLGDMSYSSYLLHFPLMTAFAIVTDKLGFARDIYYSPLMLILFMTILIPLSIFSHSKFEVKLQQKIRSSFGVGKLKDQKIPM